MDLVEGIDVAKSRNLQNLRLRLRKFIDCESFKIAKKFKIAKVYRLRKF